MAGKKQLPPVRIATADDAPSEPMSLIDAATYGSRLDELKALRLQAAAHLSNENTLARDFAAVSRQFRDISKEIEELELADEPDELGKAADTDDERFDPKAV